MDSKQIEKILRAIPASKRYFIGVFSSDTLPLNIKIYPCSLICNTDKQGKPGTHWQAMFIPNAHTCEFFDSFANQPKGEIKTFVNKYPNIIINEKPLQLQIETSCGPHVLFFIIKRSMGNSFKSIIKTLSQFKYKDAFVKLYISHIAKSI